jgi:hypothetical protein
MSATPAISHVEAVFVTGDHPPADVVSAKWLVQTRATFFVAADKRKAERFSLPAFWLLVGRFWRFERQFFCR